MTDTTDELSELAGPLNLGSFLKAIREGENWTQTEMANVLGILELHLCDIENGRVVVPPAKAAEFAETLGYSVKQLVRLAAV